MNYPYYIYPDVLALREGRYESEEEAGRLRRRIAANVGDLRTLRIILGLDPAEFARFYPDMMKQTPSTADTIDSFLQHFGKEDVLMSRAAAEIPQTYQLEDNGTENPDAPDATSSAISSFLAQNPSSATAARHSPSAATEKATLTTGEDTSAAKTFDDAQLLIKNHDYEGALEIIMRLSLINQKKSVYFADQIRFLRKLILNESKK